MKLVAFVALAVAFTSSFAWADRGSRYNRGDSWDFRSSGGFDRGHRYDNRWRHDSRWSVSVGLSTTGFDSRNHFASSCRSSSIRWHEPRVVVVRDPVIVVREPTVIVRDPVIVRESFCGPTAIVTRSVVVHEPVFVAPRSHIRFGFRSSSCGTGGGWSFSGRVVYRH
jgi:hypothetical protein